MIIRLVFFVFFVQILFPGFGYGQGAFTRPGNVPTPQYSQPGSANSDNPDWDLPPLQTLIDHALEHSPMLKLADIDIKVEEYGLKDIQREWMRKISFMTDARYGTMLDYSKMITMPGVSPATVMMSYGAGATVGFMLSDVFDRKRSKQKARWRIEQANLNRETTVSGVTQMVISSYYAVLAAQKNFALANEMNLTAALVYDKAKMDVSQNRISLTEWAKENEAYLSAKNAVELQKYTLMQSIRMLELIVGIELVKTN